MQKVLKSLALGALAAMASLGTATAADQQASLLVYRVWEEGLSPYISRVLVTPRYVRMDEGEGVSQYTLYDREKAIMYNVDDEERSVLVMDPPTGVPSMPDTLTLGQKVEVQADAPTVGGVQPQQVTLSANDDTCRVLVAVPGLMEEAVAGMRDLQGTLARIQAATLGAIPAEMQTPCDLAENVYAPLRALDHGLPIQDRSTGRSRSLVDFSAEHRVSDELFALPGDYTRTEMPGLAAPSK
jgi:hypothetical protein